MGLFDKRRPEPEHRHEDPKVRRAAVGRLSDPALLSQISRNDPDARIREEATGVLHGLALEADPETALAALEALSERRHLVSVARSAAHEGVGRAAAERLGDAKALGSVARHGRHPAVCLEAVGRISEPAELGAVAQLSEIAEVAVAALDRIASLRQEALLDDASAASLLTAVAQRARAKAAARRARALLRAGEPEAGEGRQARRETDRKRQVELCEALEALGLAEGSMRLAADISEIKDAWIDLVPDVDDDLQERCDSALRSARDRLARNETERADRVRREKERTEFFEKHVAPRISLCEMLESAEGEQASRRLEEARWEWDRLGPLLSEDGPALERRFEAALVDCERRSHAWREEQEAARLRAEREAAQAERGKLLQDNRERLERLCDRLERLLQRSPLGLPKAARGLAEVKAALADPGPFASKRELAALVKRLQAIHQALYPKVAELREGEEWERWVNAGIQEELCARAEALREVESPLEAARRLTSLQEEWRKASTVSRERSLQLWLRFKAARDEARTRLEAYRAEQAARKEALCAKAEELAPSTDWIRTAEELKRLQAEWKTVGPAGSARDRALWERFRGACDRFFGRRKEDFQHRKQEWGRNLEVKTELCAKAEALVDSTDWAATPAEIRRLQAAWRKAGPVARKQSDALWLRFRSACDRFFDRYKRRDAIEREARLAGRELILRELEGLVPADAAAPPEGLLETLQSARGRWQKGGAPSEERGEELEARFEAALGRILAAFPAVLRDSEFDSEQNRGRMEELCARVEKLLPQEGTPEDAAGASPASRLAALWVERMAANTIGGGVSDEARWRAAVEEVQKAQAAWQRIGYVPAEVRRTLAGRFERACGRVLELHERTRSAPSPKPAVTRKPSSRRSDARKS